MALPPVEHIIEPVRPRAGVLLVDVNRQLHDKLREAAVDIQEQKYDEAVEILHSLLVAEARFAYPHWNDMRRHVSSLAAANILLANLPEEDRARYARSYEAAAGARLAKALENQDLTELRRVGMMYFHTPSGEKACYQLGGLSFLRGNFLDAADAWETLMRYRPGLSIDRNLLMARTAVAYHFAGMPSRARTYASQTSTNVMPVQLAGASATLRGFVEHALRAPLPVRVEPPPVKAWSCFAGAAGGVAVMQDSAISPFSINNVPRDVQLARVRAMLQHGGEDGAPVVMGQIKVELGLRGGHALLALWAPGEKVSHVPVPPMVHPVAAGDVVITREHTAVVARDLLTGKETWRRDDLPLFKDTGPLDAPNPYLVIEGDMGRYSLSMGDGMLFVVGRYHRIDPAAYLRLGSASVANASTLAALDIDTGTSIWEIGDGKGSDENLAKAKFLGPPTLVANQLFVLAKVETDYRVFCLNARTGEQVWQRPVGPIPTHTGELESWQAAYTMELFTERFSPVSVFGDRLFLTTNAGQILALDRTDGSPLWVYRYDSSVASGPADTRDISVTSLAYLIASSRTPQRPPNPLIVSAGRVICLPCDSATVLALNAANGELLWERERETARHLSVVDSERVLLSGPGVTVLASASGEHLKEIPAETRGRPAVTTSSIILSGEAELYRIDKTDYTVDQTALPGEDGILGRLITVGDKLIAANVTGINIYPGFEGAWKQLTAALKKSRSAADRHRLLMQRGELALRSREFDKAVTDLDAAAGLSTTGGTAASRARVSELRFRALMGAAETAADASRRASLLEKAAAQADTVENKVRAALGRIRHYEQTGKPGTAVTLAQQIADNHADARLPASLLDAGAEGVMTGRDLGQREVGRLIGAHGRGIYAEMDRRAAAVIKDVKQGHDPLALLEAWKRWPHAASGPDLLFKAAEAFARQALKTADPREQVTMAAKASRILGAADTHGGRQYGFRLLAARAVLDTRYRPAAARLYPGDWFKGHEQEGFRFAGFNGPVTNLAAAASGDLGEPDGSELATFTMPVGACEMEGAEGLRVLRQRNHRPVTIGDLVVLHSERDVVGVNTADGYRPLWRLPVEGLKQLNERLGHVLPDGYRLAIYDTRDLILADLRDGSEIYRQPASQHGIRGAVPDGDLLFVQHLKAVDLPTGTAITPGNVPLLRHHGLVDASGGMSMTARYDGEGPRFFDIYTGLELATDFESRLKIPIVLSPDGFAARADNRRLLVQDPRRRVHRTLASIRDVDVAHIMGFQGPYIAARTADSVKLVLVDLTAGDMLKTIDLRETEDAPCVMLGCEWDNRTLYVLFAEQVGRDGAASRPAVAALELPGGKLRWKQRLSTDDVFLALSPLQRFGSYLTLTATPDDAISPCRPLVIDTLKGTVTAFTPDTRTGYAFRRPAGWSGSPVLLNGKLILEEPKGTVFITGSL